MFSIKAAIAFTIARLNEPSTWAGISAATGIISHHLQSHPGLGGAVAAALIAILLPEKK